jgi:hypothetical protein
VELLTLIWLTCRVINGLLDGFNNWLIK